MTLCGHARVSTGEQDLSIQEAALHAAGCEAIRSETRTGTLREGRTEPDVPLHFLRSGDTLVITRIDRLARSLKDLQDLVHELKAKGVTLRATEQPVDTSTAAGEAFFDIASACLLSSRLTLGASGSWRASPRPRRGASTRASSPRSMQASCAACRTWTSSAPSPSPAGSGSLGRARTGF
jgi:hypothetical protein